MKWTAINVPQQYGSLYESGSWRIHHYVGGCGIYIAKLYRGEAHVRDFAGERALIAAQELAEAGNED